jgi:hypothetical protein
MQKSYYQKEYINLIHSPYYSPGHEISNLAATGTVIFITDPSGADIYIDGILQSVKTSTSLAVATGNRTITFSKAGYASYVETISGLKQNQIIKVAAILGQIANITNNGIVICTTTSIASCPTTPITCPATINPLDYINLAATINSTTRRTVTVRFTYTIGDTTYYDNVTANLSIGTNTIYAWSTNRRYDVNTILTLVDVSIIS